MFIIAILLLNTLTLLFTDWYARRAFLARGYCRRYGHGKSWKRAHKHYKTNWTIWQRMLWIPVFKKKYENKYRALAYGAYMQSGLACLATICFLLNELVFNDFHLWHYVMIVFWVATTVRLVFINYVATDKL